MKKIVFILAAATMVASGVAAVSAYEAHLINVTAHVENALTIPVGETGTLDIDFGTMFPEEWRKIHRDIALSASALEEVEAGNLISVTYEVWAEWKPVPQTDPATVVLPVVLDAAGNPYYAWLGEVLYIGINMVQEPLNVSNMHLVGPALTVVGGAQPVLLDYTAVGSGTLSSTLTNNIPDLLGVGIDAPVFAGFYNALTDVDPKQSGLSVPTWIIPQSDPRWIPSGVDLGLDLKIQVIGITR